MVYFELNDRSISLLYVHVVVYKYTGRKVTVQHYIMVKDPSFPPYLICMKVLL